mgnify:FL=1
MINGMDKWMHGIPEERQAMAIRIVELLDKHLPKGFSKVIDGNFLHYQVPLETYPKGYHCTPNTPLPFISLSNQKGAFSIYHMGLYAHTEYYEWFQKSYQEKTKYKMDMGKSCLRLKRPTDVAYDVLAELFEKISVEDWIDLYESAFSK